MLRRAFLAVPFLLAAGSPALASGGGSKGEKKADVGQYVDLQPVAIPIVLEGQLVNYVFVYVRLNLGANSDISRWRQNEPVFRDRLVRMAHRQSFVLAGDPQKVDAPKLSAAMQREAVSITGPGVIKSVAITSQTSRGRAQPVRH